MAGGIRTLEYKDQILTPADSRTWHYKGKDPMRIFPTIKPMFVMLLEIDSTKVFEDLLLWDGNSGAFRGKWWAYKPFDRWTKFRITINCWGKIDLRSREKIGSMTVKLTPYLETKVEYAHDIQRGLWWTYSYMIYNERRRRWMAKSKDIFAQIEDRLKRTLGMFLEALPEEKFAEIEAGAGPT